MSGPGVPGVGVAPGRSLTPAAMEIPIPAATPATVAAITTAAMAATVMAAGAAAITAAVEGITAEDCVQEVSSRGTRLESIIPSTNLLDGPANPYLRRNRWARTR